MAFIAVAAVSAVLNGVPAHIAAIGLIFTIDAAACFYLPRLVGFSLRDARAAIGALAVIAVAPSSRSHRAALSDSVRPLSRGGALRRGVSACIDLRRSKRVRRLPDRGGAVPAAGGDQALAAPPAVGCRGDCLHPHALSVSFSGSWVALIIGGGVILAPRSPSARTGHRPRRRELRDGGHHPARPAGPARGEWVGRTWQRPNLESTRPSDRIETVGSNGPGPATPSSRLNGAPDPAATHPLVGVWTGALRRRGGQ